MASPDTIIYLIVDHKRNLKNLMPFDLESVDVHLMMLYDVLVSLI